MYKTKINQSSDFLLMLGSLGLGKVVDMSKTFQLCD